MCWLGRRLCLMFKGFRLPWTGTHGSAARRHSVGVWRTGTLRTGHGRVAARLLASRMSDSPRRYSTARPCRREHAAHGGSPV